MKRFRFFWIGWGGTANLPCIGFFSWLCTDVYLWSHFLKDRAKKIISVCFSHQKVQGISSWRSYPYVFPKCRCCIVEFKRDVWAFGKHGLQKISPRQHVSTMLDREGRSRSARQSITIFPVFTNWGGGCVSLAKCSCAASISWLMPRDQCPVSSAPPCKWPYLQESVNVISPEMLWVFLKRLKLLLRFFSRAQVWPRGAPLLLVGRCDTLPTCLFLCDTHMEHQAVVGLFLTFGWQFACCLSSAPDSASTWTQSPTSQLSKMKTDFSPFWRLLKKFPR